MCVDWKPDPPELDELVIEDDLDFLSSSPLTDLTDLPTASHAALAIVVQLYSVYVFDHPATLDGSTITLSLKRDFLPLSMQATCGFTVSPVLLDLTFTVSNGDWRAPPTSKDLRHPTLRRGYVGASLAVTAFESFFTSSYAPKTTYRSQDHILMPDGVPDATGLRALTSQGFDERAAWRALLVSANDAARAAAFLRTGSLPARHAALPVDYASCPLLYLVLELADAFLDIQDHCCMCRRALPTGVKPLVCGAGLCNFQYRDIGVGLSVIGEIRRDPAVADLLLSVFSMAAGTAFLTPAPPDYRQADAQALLRALPAMGELVAQCGDDAALRARVTPAGFALLQWVLCSNRAHLIALPAQLRLGEIASQSQFMAILDSPEKEEVFNAIKAGVGSGYLWHGSRADRWHSIIRNGLKNATGTPMQACGAALGPGIYLARDSAVSWGYSAAGANGYARSALGASLQIISLCEVANLPAGEHSIQVSRPGGGVVTCAGFLKDHGWAHTLTMENACVVRFLVVGGAFKLDVRAKPPARVPTLRDVLDFQATLAK